MASEPSADVRMRGFASRQTVEQALAWLDGQLNRRIKDLPTEAVDLSAATERVLARDVVATVSVPGFRRAMMDGFAIQAASAQGASSYNPLPLMEIGTSLPGRAFDGQVGPGEGVRIMTGAPLPAGADAVLPAELIDFEHAPARAIGEVAVGRHIGQVGEDIAEGSSVFRASRRLRPQDIGVLSSIGEASVTVVRRPRVRLVITGNEILPAGNRPGDYQIADANGPMLAALVARDGGEAIHPGIVPDEREAIREALGDDADLVIVSGGSSVGQEDHAPLLVAELGELAVHGIAMRPSSPSGMGVVNDRFVFLLPGNPVSCLCAYDFYAGRAVRALAGRDRQLPYRTMTKRLRRKLVSVVGRVDYARVQAVEDGVEPLAISGASMLSSTTRAAGFVIIPADCEGYPPGAEVEVYWYDR